VSNVWIREETNLASSRQCHGVKTTGDNFHNLTMIQRRQPTWATPKYTCTHAPSLFRQSIFFWSCSRLGQWVQL